MKLLDIYKGIIAQTLFFLKRLFHLYPYTGSVFIHPSLIPRDLTWEPAKVTLQDKQTGVGVVEGGSSDGGCGAALCLDIVV